MTRADGSPSQTCKRSRQTSRHLAADDLHWDELSDDENRDVLLASRPDGEVLPPLRLATDVKRRISGELILKPP